MGDPEPTKPPPELQMIRPFIGCDASSDRLEQPVPPWARIRRWSGSTSEKLAFRSAISQQVIKADLLGLRCFARAPRHNAQPKEESRASLSAAEALQRQYACPSSPLLL